MSNTEAPEKVTRKEADDDDPPVRKSLYLFGTDLLQIPCMRRSLLNGYVGAVVGGVAGFLYKSEMRYVYGGALGSYWLVATATWITCRYKYSQEKKIFDELFKKSKAEDRVLKTGEYNIPVAVKKLNERSAALNKAPEKDSS